MKRLIILYVRYVFNHLINLWNVDMYIFSNKYIYITVIKMLNIYWAVRTICAGYFRAVRKFPNIRKNLLKICGNKEDGWYDILFISRPKSNININNTRP